MRKEAMFGMALLGPWIGEKRVDAMQRLWSEEPVKGNSCVCPQ
jgi:hypothetical protein